MTEKEALKIILDMIRPRIGPELSEETDRQILAYAVLSSRYFKLCSDENENENEERLEA